MATLRGEKTRFYYSTTTGGSATSEVTGLLSLSGADSTVSEVDTTTLNTTHKTFRPNSIVESGTVSFSVIYDAAVHGALRTLVVTTPELRNWKITYSDASTHSFAGFLTKASLSGAEVEGSEIICDFELRISGAIT
jgi:hypothetical protein